MQIHIPGQVIYALYDTELNGFLTWEETKQKDNIIGVLCFTDGELAEEHIARFFRHRPVSVYPIVKTRARTFLGQMINSKIDYMLLDVPCDHIDPFVYGLDKGADFAETDLERSYAIVDLKAAAARLFH